MSIRTRLLMCALVSLCLLGANLRAETEIQDFDFADSEDEAKVVVKREAVYADDEDIVSADAPSAPFVEEGSGVLDNDSFTARPFVGNYIRYYRVTINITNLVHTASLDDRTSREFQQLSNQIQRDIEQIFRNSRGHQAITILNFSEGSLLVTFDIGSDDATQEEVRGVLETALRSGRLGTNNVSFEGFTIKALDTSADCPAYVGRSPNYLPRQGLNWASLLINNVFPCDGTVLAWEYYRLSTQGSAFVGVWRQIGNTEFTLIRKTELPAAAAGLNSVDVEVPIQVQQGDFIGIFYPRSTPENVVAQATIIDDAISDTELFQIYSAQFYEDSVREGASFDIKQVPNTSFNASFSIRAVMQYDWTSRRGAAGDANLESPYSCEPNQFSCGDSYCIEKVFVCDGQDDCKNALDEQNCDSVPALEEPCIEGRFRCNDGTCISRILRCNGNRDCPDGSDESRCTNCRDSEFVCSNKECISDYLRCNGQSDCQDGSDELGCSTPATGCKDDDFLCKNKNCIHISRRCDAFPDCDDGSDEDPDICLSVLTTFPPTCPGGFYKCVLGGCIETIRRCDNRRDCLDGSDELNCVFTCGSAEFTCDSGQCVDFRRRCDSTPDCVDQSDENGCPCTSDQFECSDRQCLSLRQRCDDSVDCRDGSDEIGCPCLESEFRCSDGQCIPNSQVCDRRSDCTDNTDESDCPRCRRNEFECNDGTCIDVRYKCDRSTQCPDGSDEFNCTCNAAEFRCRNGQCIPQQAVCDLRRDCYDASDELNCPVTCRGDEFTCANGECVDRRRFCDGRADCTDRSDEQNCPTSRPCPENQFQCDTGHCLDLQRRCDGRSDCPNGSDEVDCPTCSPTEYTCATGQCISSVQRCDRRNDCPDGSDERNCPCLSEEFTCTSDGRCLPAGYRCNGNTECRDGSDELGCVPQCSVREFKCSNNDCVSLSARCDGRLDCSDSSDERDCPSGVSITISPQQMRKRAGTSASFICQVIGNPPPTVVWSRRSGGAMPPQAVDSNGRLTIVNLRLEDAGDYLCRAISVYGTFEAVARLDVDYIGPVTEIPNSNGSCSRDQATCTNGNCIPRDYVCDGDNDCFDDSDERNCNTALPCEPNEFRCDNRQCALKIWRCDGDNDCLDKSDESNCPTRIPGAACQSDEFACRTINQCIPFAYQCDSQLDCNDRSDEIGCIPPTIVVPPAPEITVEVNGTFTIICEAVGVPTPLIVWRLNWGNIPSGDRVTVTSIDGRGTLTIRNAVIEDAGAYTCEAINNRGSIFAIPDALIIVRRTIGVCQLPRFNVDAARPDECIRCFCFGLTQTCYSSNLQISQVTLGNQVALVRRTTLEPTEQGFIQYIPSSREFEVRDFNNILRSGSYYWSLPYQYLSKRLSSYGGELTYRVYYEVDQFDVPTSDPDVIISGNGITLHHRSQTAFRPRSPTSINVPLVESAWERSRDSPRGGPISEYATREDLMLVLENVTTILIRASYDNRQTLIRLGNVLLTTGVPQITGRGRATSVEECTCPTGYTGQSCEECAAGFYRVEQGRYGRECVACNCNGRSNDCDPFSGVCRNCRDYTAGPYCNECAVGYVRDPRSSRPDICQPCPCPLTTPANQFSRTCTLDLSGEIICTACPEGYTGRRCDRCADRFQGNPLIPGDRCIPKGADVCDERGSVSNLPDVLTQQCACKTNAEGQYCNRCKPDTFHLSSDNPRGCISCFCMGMSQTCQSTTWTRAQVSLPFSQSTSGLVLTDMMQKETVSQGLSLDGQFREVVFRGFNNIDSSIRYWSLPQQFLGDKVTSYGGNLRFTLRYRAGRDSTPVSTSDPLVEIGGNDIILLHRSRVVIPEGRQQSFSIPLFESQWYRLDEVPATREHFMMVLADLKFILIRATHSRDTEESAISGITLDIAESRDAGQERAYTVEQCACPRGYKGLSCEDCDTGYTRSGKGLYLGLCEPCRCSGHSSECDPETGVCRNCRHNTQGEHCELCSRGYYGDATRGSVNDCQKCPCPLTESPNQFSPECTLDVDRQVTCSSCPIGHTGRRCERCATGYEGNPNQPGDFCKLINVTCDCDGRGTVANTLCDPNTQQCQCKNNVHGRRCSACLDGYFYLNRENEMGCLKCFCMGVTNRCSSSAYYRDEIVPMLNSDGTHNFQLTNRRLSRTISDGFTINAERNEITFNNFEGIQREQESLFFALPPKFRGDKISSYGGYLKFGLSYTTSFDAGRPVMDVDVEIISKQDIRFFYLHRPPPTARESNSYEILLTESSFRTLTDGQPPSRETFLSVLADIDAILIRATYQSSMDTVTLRDLRMEIAVPRPTGQRGSPEVESCVCPEGYTGLSCQECAPGYLRVEDSGTALGRCVSCNCNGHATSCDPQTGVCQNCQHNTVGDRCERCAPGFYGDPVAGTAYDCRTCPCPLTIPSNQFSPTCFLDVDTRVTCDGCPPGYTGRDCGQCAPGFQGNPLEPGGRCIRQAIEQVPEVTVNPASLSSPLGSTAIFQCIPSGRSPFNVVWSRIDGRPLPRRATQGPGPNYLLTITNLEFVDSAKYVCQVTNAYGTVREYATLNVERLETPIRVRIEEPTTIVSRLGLTARFVCVAVQYSFAANYVLSWTKDGGILPSKSIDQNGVLTIPNLNEDDLGTYTCTGSDPGSVDRATATITFGAVLEPPTVRIEPRFLRLSEGERVEFRCIVEGSPRPTVRWTKGESGPLPSHIYTDETGLFRITSASADDQSDYYCTATNSQGTSSVRTIIYVQRQTPVQVVVRRTNITAVIGQSEQLVCYAEGNNEVILIWSRDGGLPFGASQENGILTLTNIQPSYAGTYVCTGRTPTGIPGTATARITVTGTQFIAPTARIEPDRQIIGSGTTGTLRCIVSGEPWPVTTWSRANAQLSSNHQVSGEYLRVLQATMEDRGVYVCSVSNVAGNAQASAIVDIERREQPVVELYPGIQQVVTIGSSAIFTCRIVGGVPAPVVTWSRVGGQGFTSRTEIISDMSSIRFTAITPEEQGEYVCSATNDIGTVTATASLRVIGPPIIQITPSKRITSLVGDVVNIECVGIGDPAPTVFWRSGQKRRSDVLPEALEAGPSAARILFESIKKADEGQYICVATNERGRAEETVDVSVLESDGSVRPSVSILGPQRLSLVTGQSVELTCSSQGLTNPRIIWRRPGNQPLPPGHSVRSGVLYIPRIEPEYSGEYICSVLSDTLSAEFSATIHIIVNVTPRITITPSRVSTRSGQSLQLRCQPSGQGPFNIEWTKLDGQLSPQARDRDGVLEIRQVTRADAGRYRCVATSAGGSTEGFADVIVLAPPVAEVVTKQNQAVIGSTLEIRCNVQGDPPPAIRWEKDRGSLPLQHQIRNGVLTIYNIQPSDSGRYLCIATNDAGTATDFSIIAVDDPYVTNGPGVQRVNVGDRVELECVVTGTNIPTVTWTKLEGPLPQSAIVGAGILIIPEVRGEDAGTYQCTATNIAGTVQSRVELVVQGRPQFSVQQDYTTAALGTPAQLRCDTSGSPDPRISWIKESGDLPYDHSVLEDGGLYIPKVRPEDGGTYNCLASNQFGVSRYPVVLVVGAFVPYFQQNPVSYVQYEPLRQEYIDLDILLSFRPETTDGLLLYNGQFQTASGDFVCFGLQEQYPEFRFDVGSGAATIRGSQQLELNKWHTVHLKRSRKNGTLLVNDEAPYYGVSAGDFEGLDLQEPLFLGNVPDPRNIPASARFASGFVGGVSQLKIKGVDINLGADAREIVQVEQYQVCRDAQCQNGGSCRPYNTRFGFVCDCPRGLTGERCELIGERCYQGACGAQGRCYNLPAVSGFACICPFGYAGEGCLQSIRVADPEFNKTSFISYPTIKDGLLSVSVRLLFKPKSLDDGIVLYNSQRQDGKHDFIAVIIKDQHLEFRFDTGSGPAILRSRRPLSLDGWTTVLVTRKGRDGMLVVNNDEVVNEQVDPSDELLFSRLERGDVIRGTASGDKTVGLNLERPLYLGGVDPFENINPHVGTYAGFVGCVGELVVGDNAVKLIEDAIESLNIRDCGDRRLCERRPCRNNAQCVDVSPTQYTCICSAQFTGNNCETEIDVCVSRRPCQNGGQCVVVGNSFRCNCPLPWLGDFCNHREPLGNSVEVIGHGYIEFNKDLLPHRQRNTVEAISVTISTTEPNGLFFWQGQQAGNQEGKDYLALAVKDGYVEFSYELGSGAAVIKSTVTVDDGFSHLVVAERLGRNGSLIIDDQPSIKGAARGALQVLNVPGNIYFGGVPDLTKHTGNLFQDNFIGCITNIKLQNDRVLSFDSDPVGGMNVRLCKQTK
uniref:Basement membrane-specific heparan sulfate proteoglycan core protein n=1 Tax=Arion vulgaris TaxID=1028688 RepID=A0A0B7ATX1_9EUPU